jgi:ferrous iron transport protein B
MPTVGAILRSMWERCSSFIKKAGTIILIASIVVWVGSVFGKGGFNPDMELEDSILGMISNAIKWVFAPLGFDDIRATIATAGRQKGQRSHKQRKLQIVKKSFHDEFCFLLFNPR